MTREKLIRKGVVRGPREWGEAQGKRGGAARSRVAGGAAMAFGPKRRVGKEEESWEGKSENWEGNESWKM